MNAVIMAIVGAGLTILCFFISVILNELNRQRLSVKSISLLVGFGAGMFLFGSGVKDSSVGEPKTAIKAGSYTVVEYAEVLNDKQLYYYIVLKQGNEVEFYTLQKDMVYVVYQLPEAGEKLGILEVIEKSGLRKATLYIPLQK